MPSIKPIRLQAREIVRAAKRHNIKMSPYSYYTCVVAVLGKVAGIEGYAGFKTGNIATNLNINVNDINGLESGFENWSDEFNKNRYYRVGQNIRKLIGLTGSKTP